MNNVTNLVRRSLQRVNSILVGIMVNNDRNESKQTKNPTSMSWKQKCCILESQPQWYKVVIHIPYYLFLLCNMKNFRIQAVFFNFHMKLYKENQNYQFTSPRQAENSIIHSLPFFLITKGCCVLQWISRVHFFHEILQWGCFNRIHIWQHNVTPKSEGVRKQRNIR